MPGKVLIQPADISPYIRHSINEDVEVKKIRTELGGKHFDL